MKKSEIREMIKEEILLEKEATDEEWKNY